MLLAVALTLSPVQSDTYTFAGEFDTSFKAFMHYETITSKSSNQWKLQQKAKTVGVFRKVDNRLMVAVGTGYGVGVGGYIDVTLDTGKVLHCIVGDLKQDVHTDATNMYKPLEQNDGTLVYNEENGLLMVNVVEFIVGDITDEMWATGQVTNLEGEVIKIEVLPSLD